MQHFTWIGTGTILNDNSLNIHQFQKPKKTEGKLQIKIIEPADLEDPKYGKLCTILVDIVYIVYITVSCRKKCL